jgi:hypothetical protein
MCEDSELPQCKFDRCEKEEESITEDISSLRGEYLAAKLATERKRCEFLEIRVQTVLKKLIPADEVRHAMFAKGRIIRDGILNIPDRIAPLLLNKSDSSEIHDILMHELREVLEELSRDD